VTRNRVTVEKLAKDTLDVRELNRAGLAAGLRSDRHTDRRIARTTDFPDDFGKNGGA
jgi:hypothetical protein